MITIRLTQKILEYGHRLDDRAANWLLDHPDDERSLEDLYDEQAGKSFAYALYRWQLFAFDEMQVLIAPEAYYDEIERQWVLLSEDELFKAMLYMLENTHKIWWANSSGVKKLTQLAQKGFIQYRPSNA